MLCLRLGVRLLMYMRIYLCSSAQSFGSAVEVGSGNQFTARNTVFSGPTDKARSSCACRIV